MVLVPWADTVAAFREMHYNGHNAGTCGLQIVWIQRFFPQPDPPLQVRQLLRALSVSSMVRSTDATGIAYNSL